MSFTSLEQRTLGFIARKHSGYYGLGVYIDNNDDGNTAYYAVGGDFGVELFTAYFPKQKIVASALANTEVRLFSLLRTLLQVYRESGE